MFDSFVTLSEHIHELRAAASGRPPGNAMRFSEVWQAAIDCPRNGISGVRYFDEQSLPEPFSGIFVRLSGYDSNLAAVYVDRDLGEPWKEFASIKEMMHCWSPGHTYVGTSGEAKDLVGAHVAPATPFPSSVNSDNKAILAAAEVILPHYTAERYITQGKDFAQIAFECGLDPVIVRFICSPEILRQRKQGAL